MAKISSDNSRFLICYKKWVFLSCINLAGFERSPGNSGKKRHMFCDLNRSRVFTDQVKLAKDIGGISTAHRVRVLLLVLWLSLSTKQNVKISIPTFHFVHFRGSYLQYRNLVQWQRCKRILSKIFCPQNNGKYLEIQFSYSNLSNWMINPYN